MTRNFNRWFVVLGALLVQPCIGAIYTWSLFNRPLMNKFGWEKSEVVMTFSIAIFIFAFSTMFSGRLQDKVGPKIVTVIGGLLYGIGLMLVSTATSLPQLYIYFGVIAGAGVGFVYVCPLSTCVKWFPEKKGFISGVALGAFGLGSLIFLPLVQFLIASYGVSEAFFYLGITYLTLIVLGAQLLVTPDKKNIVPYINGKQPREDDSYTVGEMMKTNSFYLIWIIFFFACISGLLIIGLGKDIGIQLANLEPPIAAGAVATISLFNAGGRLMWGSISDKVGRLKVVFVMFTITALSMLLMSLTGLTYTTFFIYLAAIAFCFGGFLAVFPTITSEFYGLRHLGSNYGIVYQAYGLAALIGPIIVANTGGLKPTFMIAALFSIIGAGLTLLVKEPKQ